jgi:hypothetical protein
MLRIKGPPNSCTLTSLAMILSVPYDVLDAQLYELFGIHGDEPTGVHHRECDLLCRSCYRQTLSQLDTRLVLPNRDRSLDIWPYLRGQYGMLYTLAMGRRPHMMAWDGHQAIDPSTGDVAAIMSTQVPMAWTLSVYA